MDIRELSIEQIGLSRRSVNCLMRSDIRTVGQMLETDEDILFHIKNMGKQSVEEVLKKSAEFREKLENGETRDPQKKTEEFLTPVTAELLPIEEIGLSTRSVNCLTQAGILTVGSLLKTNPESLYRIRNMGWQSVKEVLRKAEEYRKRVIIGLTDKGPEQTPGEMTAWAETEEGRTALCDLYARQNRTIDELELLSARSYNLLSMSGYTDLGKVLFLSPKALLEIPHMDTASAREIEMACAEYRREHHADYEEAFRMDSIQSLSLDELLRSPEYMDIIFRFVKANDRSLGTAGLSNRSLSRLTGNGYQNLSDILFLTWEDLRRIPGMGQGSIDEILDKVRAFLAEKETRLRSVLMGDETALLTDDGVRQKVLELYIPIGFKGLHFPEIREMLSLPSSFTDQRLKTIIGSLLAKGDLEYTDFCCYRVYPRFPDYLARCEEIDDRARNLIRRRLEGRTLMEVGEEFGLTRERVRQIVNKNVEKVRNQYLYESGSGLFDEDYYRHLYETYAFEKKDAVEWLGIPSETFPYFEMQDVKQGIAELESALDDKEIEAGLRMKIRNYLNCNKIRIGNRWVEKKRSALEPVVLEKYGRDTISFEDFCACFNRFLKEQDVPYDDTLYYTDAVLHARKSRLAEMRFVLRKQNEKLRYYDIDGQDYTELIDGLGLAEYENTELSTAKWFKEHPDLMKKYDIRDQYELHNLLKKAVGNGSYHNIQFERTPHILFGTFDREAAILELLRDNAPITADDLANLIESEYGFDPAVTKANYLLPFAPYYHQGVYRIDQKPMEKDRMNALLEALPDDFYYTDEVRGIYVRLFPDADPEEINPYNLKRMGFQIFFRYVLKNHASLDAFFRELLTKDDMTDLTPCKRRFSNVTAFYATYMDLRRELSVIEYEPDRIIAFRKLEKAGIAKADLKAFCDEVFAFAPEDACFSILSLKQDGFVSNLFDLGFSDCFYGSVLLSDDRFTFGMIYGTLVFRKDGTDPVIRGLLEERIRTHGSIDAYDLMNELTERYGCRIGDRYDIDKKLYGSAVYHDRFTDRYYPDQDAFEREVEETEVLYQ